MYEWTKGRANKRISTRKCAFRYTNFKVVKCMYLFEFLPAPSSFWSICCSFALLRRSHDHCLVWSRTTLAICSCLGCSLSRSLCFSLFLSCTHTTHFTQWIVPLFRYFARCFVCALFFRILRPFWFHKIRQYLILVFKYRPNSIDISHYCVPATHAHTIADLIAYIVSHRKEEKMINSNIWLDRGG